MKYSKGLIYNFIFLVVVLLVTHAGLANAVPPIPTTTGGTVSGSTGLTTGGTILGTTVTPIGTTATPSLTGTTTGGTSGLISGTTGIYTPITSGGTGFSYSVPCDPTLYNVTGWLWSDGLGWVSLNCSNSESTSSMQFGVSQDSNGFWHGYGYSTYGGWINFDGGYPAGSEGYLIGGTVTAISGTRLVSGTTTVGGTTQPIKRLVGYAKIINGSNDNNGWISWSCFNDHDYIQASVNTNPNCGSGSNSYGPQFVGYPTGSTFKLTGFGWGALNWGWIGFRDVIITPPTTAGLLLTPSSSSVYSPYKVNLTWTSTQPAQFGTDQCDTESRATGTTTTLTTTNWSTVSTLLPPSTGIPSRTQNTVDVPQASVDYRITCNNAGGTAIQSNWVTVARASVPVTLSQSCLNTTTAKVSWLYTASANSCRLFKDGVRIGSGLPLSDTRNVTADGTYEVKCYTNAADADTSPIGTSNIETVSVATSCGVPPHTVDVSASCTGTTPTLNWNDNSGGIATSCSVYKSGVLQTSGLSLSDSQTTTVGSYEVKCYNSNPNAISAGGPVSVVSCTSCTATTTYTQNPTCFCSNHPTDAACQTDYCPSIPGIQVSASQCPTTGAGGATGKPGVTEDKK